MNKEPLILTFAKPELKATKTDVKIAGTSVHAGFPSPADDFMEDTLDLNRALISHPSATFYIRVQGESMKDAEIHTNDILVVDKSIEPYHNCIAVCYIDGEFTLKRVCIHKTDEGETITLVPANKDFSSITITPENDFIIWGIVRYTIHKL